MAVHRFSVSIPEGAIRFGDGGAWFLPLPSRAVGAPTEPIPDGWVEVGFTTDVPECFVRSGSRVGSTTVGRPEYPCQLDHVVAGALICGYVTPGYRCRNLPTNS
jgi:hypothetical protein